MKEESDRTELQGWELFPSMLQQQQSHVFKSEILSFYYIQHAHSLSFFLSLVYLLFFLVNFIWLSIIPFMLFPW